MTQTKDIVRRAGDTFPETIQLVSAHTGEPVNLQGCELELAAHRGKGGVEVWTTAGTITDQANGIVEFEITAEHAAQRGRLYYEARMIDGFDRIRTVLQGNLTFN